MSYILIICNARYWDTEKGFFKAVDNELDKHFEHMYSSTYKDEHKHLILISYDEVISSPKVLDILNKLRIELKYISKSFRGDIAITLLGESLWM